MNKKIFLLLAAVAALPLLRGAEEMSVFLTKSSSLYIRRAWSDSEDLLHFCGLGGNNRQFNFLCTGLIPRSLPEAAVPYKMKQPPRFHWCGDSVGVMHLYPHPDKRTIYILSGNHGFNGTEVTWPGHGYKAEDAGKKLDGSHWIARVISPDKLVVLPAIGKQALPKAAAFKAFYNFPATRILNRGYLLDGKVLPTEKLLKGRELTVIEKQGICTFEALAAAGFKHANVTDYYAVFDLEYHFFPNGSCRVDAKVTFMRDVQLMGVSPMQDSDLELRNYDFYEKYIPKVKAFQEKPVERPRADKLQAWHHPLPAKKLTADTRPYDFAGVQEMTAIRKEPANISTRFQLRVRGGYVDPDDQPDRFIEFLGKNVDGKRVRKIGNVLGMDPEWGMYGKSERAKNATSFILAAWHKTYPSQFGRPGRATLKKGTVLEGVGYRCYFNPERIGDATALYVIPHRDHRKLYADFHKSVRNYVLPFGADEKARIVEASPGVTLEGNKVSVSGKYGFIVLRLPRKK